MKSSYSLAEAKHGIFYCQFRMMFNLAHFLFEVGLKPPTRLMKLGTLHFQMMYLMSLLPDEPLIESLERTASSRTESASCRTESASCRTLQRLVSPSSSLFRMNDQGNQHFTFNNLLQNVSPSKKKRVISNCPGFFPVAHPLFQFFLSFFHHGLPSCSMGWGDDTGGSHMKTEVTW